MDFLKQLASWILHFDTHLAWFVSQFHDLTYFILAAIVFIENGIVFIPFLPGDSLLFVCGAFAAKGVLDVWILVITLMVASVLGGMLNYFVGIWAANRFSNQNVPFLNPSHIEKTNKYFSKYGALTVVVGRFFPIVRTFAPFLAGFGRMDFSKFIFYNFLGSLIWILVFTFGGYFFGGIPIIADNMVAVIMGILIISILPIVVRGFISSRLLSKNKENG